MAQRRHYFCKDYHCMSGFANYIGNQPAIALAKKSFPGASITIIVGKVSGGRTFFAECLMDHFKDSFRFVKLDNEDGIEALKNKIHTIASRKVGVMEAYINGGSSTQHSKKSLRFVMDDIDCSERGLSGMLESVAERMQAGNGFLIVTDVLGLRKLSFLKKKGALVIVLTPPGKDAVTRWARKTYLGDSPEEDDLIAMKQLLKTCGHSISLIRSAMATEKTVMAASRIDKPDESDFVFNVDNMTMMQTLFVRGATVDQMLQIVQSDGGSMVGQLMWHNAPVCVCDEDMYSGLLDKALDGMTLERSGHLRHEKELCNLGHMLTISPFCKLTPKLDKASLTYTSTMAHGGARAVARKSIAKHAENESVSERAYR